MSWAGDEPPTGRIVEAQGRCPFPVLSNLEGVRACSWLMEWLTWTCVSSVLMAGSNSRKGTPSPGAHGECSTGEARR